MPNAITQEFLDATLEIVEEFGFVADYKVFSGGTYDAGERTYTTPETLATFLAVPCAVPEEPNDSWIPPTLIRVGDTQIILPLKGTGFTPAPGTEVTFGGDIWKCEHVGKLWVQEVVAYVLLLRR